MVKLELVENIISLSEKNIHRDVMIQTWKNRSVPALPHSLIMVGDFIYAGGAPNHLSAAATLREPKTMET